MNKTSDTKRTNKKPESEEGHTTQRPKNDNVSTKHYIEN
jgi:hypothetical protein